MTALHNWHAQQMAQSIENILTEPGELGLRGEVGRLVRAAMAAHEVEPNFHRQLQKERPFFEGLPHDGGLGGEIHRHIQRLLEKHSEDISHSEMAQAAWMTMRMTESLVHMTVLHPPKNLDVLRIEGAIVDAIFAFLTYRPTLSLLIFFALSGSHRGPMLMG